MAPTAGTVPTPAVKGHVRQTRPFRFHFLLKALLILGVLTSPCVSAEPNRSAVSGQAAPKPPEGAAQPPLPIATLNINGHPVIAELAVSPAQHSRGLMFRKTMAPNHGMLFIFSEPVQTCFWMKNTYLPLSIAFIGPEGEIINLADMQPLSEATHCALAPAQYALEMNQGWFVSQGVKPGDRIQGLPVLRRQR